MITINIADEARLAVVATIIDQPTLEPFIIEMRDRLGLSTALIPYEQFGEEYKSLSYQMDEQEKTEYQKMNERYEWLMNKSDSYSQKEFESLHKKIMEWQSPRFLFEQRVKEALKSYPHGDEIFASLIKAIVCGAVGEDDFSHRPARGRLEQVRKNRRLYWLNKRSANNRMSYRNLAEEKIEGIDNPKSAEQAVRSYIRLLKQAEPAF